MIDYDMYVQAKAAGKVVLTLGGGGVITATFQTVNPVTGTASTPIIQTSSQPEVNQAVTEKQNNLSALQTLQTDINAVVTAAQQNNPPFPS